MAVQTIYRQDGINRGFTRLANGLLQDQRLSYAARGLAADLLSRPIDWEITAAGIAQLCPHGRDFIYKLLKELKKYGYLLAFQERNKKTGKLGSHQYVIGDNPEYLKQKYEEIAYEIEAVKSTGSGNPVNGKKTAYVSTVSGKSVSGEKPLPEKPLTGDADTTKDRYKQTTEELSIAREEKFALEDQTQNKKIYDPKDFKTNHKLPDYWKVELPLRAWARNGKIGATDEQIDDQAEWFRDYHLSHGKRMRDWNKAFQTWMRNAKNYGKLDQKTSLNQGRFENKDDRDRRDREETQALIRKKMEDAARV